MNDTLLLITRHGMGAADEALELKLLDTYLKLLLQNEMTPGVIACYTEGVRGGIVGGMGNIQAAQVTARKVITL